MVIFIIYLQQTISSPTPMTNNNEPPKEVMDIIYANQPTSRNFTQNFQVSHQLVTHEHKVQVQLTDQKGQNLEILNFFTFQKDQKLYKLTEIKLENRIIKIVDSFQTQQLHTDHSVYHQLILENSKPQNQKLILTKSLQVQKSRESEEQIKSISRDTKTVVKNIIRLFLNWIEKRILFYKQVYDLVTKIIQNGKYNSNPFTIFSKIAVIRKAFLEFVHSDAKGYIGSSKISDKNQHLEALQHWEELCAEQEDIFESDSVQPMEIISADHDVSQNKVQ